ncbi:hypothetical protein BDP27DRAFT_1422555 [Rhodocollybia butyracea]|uniref:Uncharacterized protein n=1 Tax=Rhodocollybia butyracea TaxID=206335 RepID=A0A9P5U6I4_9AGAR|nr:hypothetical protein BDP27DRAFT_1422555 [Rhodocollybia butyracea]
MIAIELSAFSVLDNPAPESSTDPFDAFIRGNPSNEDPFKFWTAAPPHHKSQTITGHQALAFMALDFLSAAAASTDIEHFFTFGSCWNWVSVEGLVPVRDIQRKLDKGYGKEKHFVSDDEPCWSDSEVEKDKASESEAEPGEIIEVECDSDNDSSGSDSE